METGDRARRERALRRAVLAGDEEAWRQWYEQEFSGLFAYVSWRCAGWRDLTEEVVQDTWLVAVRRIRRFDPEQASFQSWLRGIAANAIRNRLRTLRRKPTQPLDGRDLPATIQTDETERSEHVTRALAALPERYQEVLRAKYLEQQSVEHIAQAWQETPKAIESLLTRAREAFREVYRQRD